MFLAERTKDTPFVWNINYVELKTGDWTPSKVLISQYWL